MTAYSNPRKHAVIADWPIGAQRTTATFTIEHKPGKGERAVRVTIDPKTGLATAPKALTYATQARIVDGDDGRTYIVERSMYGHISVMQGTMKFQHEVVYKDDLRHAELLALFAEVPA